MGFKRPRRENPPRLANLVLLSHHKNKQAQNYDLKRKKVEYFQKCNVATYALWVTPNCSGFGSSSDRSTRWRILLKIGVGLCCCSVSPMPVSLP